MLFRSRVHHWQCARSLGYTEDRSPQLVKPLYTLYAHRPWHHAQHVVVVNLLRYHFPHNHPHPYVRFFTLCLRFLQLPRFLVMAWSLSSARLSERWSVEYLFLLSYGCSHVGSGLHGDTNFGTPARLLLVARWSSRFTKNIVVYQYILFLAR